MERLVFLIVFLKEVEKSCFGNTSNETTWIENLKTGIKTPVLKINTIFKIMEGYKQ